MIRIVVGYDRRMPVLFNVFAHSIIRRASQPVALTALSLDNLGPLMTRELNPLQSTEFSFSRFLAPYLCNYEGWVLFFDNDMLMLDDIAKLWALRDERYAVQVVKHGHKPRETKKFLGAAQTSYEKKNWSSVILFNCTRCQALTPEYVNTASGLELHQFKWLESDELIGEIPHRWNHLVDYDDTIPVSEISNVHYTLGGPYFAETRDCPYADLWLAEQADLDRVEPKPLV